MNAYLIRNISTATLPQNAPPFAQRKLLSSLLLWLPPPKKQKDPTKKGHKSTLSHLPKSPSNISFFPLPMQHPLHPIGLQPFSGISLPRVDLSLPLKNTTPSPAPIRSFLTARISPCNVLTSDFLLKKSLLPCHSLISAAKKSSKWWKYALKIS